MQKFTLNYLLKLIVLSLLKLAKKKMGAYDWQLFSVIPNWHNSVLFNI